MDVPYHLHTYIFFWTPLFYVFYSLPTGYTTTISIKIKNELINNQPMPHHRHRSPHPLPTNTPSNKQHRIIRAHHLAPVLFCVGITGESGVSKTPCPPIRLRARFDKISGCSKGSPKMGNVFFRSDFCGDHGFIWISFIGRWPMAIFWKAGCWLSFFVFRQI